MAFAFNTRLTDNYSERANCGETPSGTGDIRTGAHTLGYWTESNDPTPAGNGFLRVSLCAWWLTCKLPPSLFDATSPLDFQWAPTP